MEKNKEMQEHFRFGKTHCLFLFYRAKDPKVLNCLKKESKKLPKI